MKLWEVLRLIALKPIFHIFFSYLNKLAGKVPPIVNIIANLKSHQHYRIGMSKDTEFHGDQTPTYSKVIKPKMMHFSQWPHSCCYNSNELQLKCYGLTAGISLMQDLILLHYLFYSHFPSHIGPIYTGEYTDIIIYWVKATVIGNKCPHRKLCQYN